MKAFLLDKFSGEKGVSSFHYHMFHGLAVGEPLETLLAPYHEYKSFTRPLQLVRNGWRIPDIFRPMFHLIVSRRVHDLVAGAWRYLFPPVQFVKLIDYPYRVYDDSFFESDEYRRWPEGPKSMLQALPDVPELHKKAGEYYEVIVPYPPEVDQDYTDARLVPVSVPFIASL